MKAVNVRKLNDHVAIRAAHNAMVPVVQFMWLAKDMSQTGMFIEQLRYAGLLTVVRETEAENQVDTWFVCQMRAPKGLNAAVWAQQNAERMQSFGINAAVVKAVR